MKKEIRKKITELLNRKDKTKEAFCPVCGEAIVDNVRVKKGKSYGSMYCTNCNFKMII